MRFSLCYVSFKDRKAVASDRKGIYRAASAGEAEQQLEAFAEKWDARYPSIAKSWRSNWSRVTPVFGLPVQLRATVARPVPLSSSRLSSRASRQAEPSLDHRSRRAAPPDDPAALQRASKTR